MSHWDRLHAALSDRYRIEREIGSGGMAIVYRARDLKHDRDVAVKVLNPELAQTLGAERFLREIKTAAGLSHPHILPVHDSGEAGGFLYFVMPYVKGETLRTRLEKEGQLPVEDAVRITREVADALAYAHRQGVVHRDVKPANIMLQEGHAVLADFGVAHAVAEARDERLTRTGTSLGTPAYMSPEQAAGEEKLDGRSDQYALGCVLYEMLAGRPPFSGAQVEAVLRQHLTVGPPPVRQARPLVPPEVAEVVERALAKSPADRFRTTGEMAAALTGPVTLPSASSAGGSAVVEAGSSLWAPEGAGAGHPPRMPSQADTVRPTQAARRRARTRTLAYAGIGVLLLAAGGFATYEWLVGGAPSDLPEDVVVVIPFGNETGDPKLDPIGKILAARIADALTSGGLAQAVPSQKVSSAWEGARAQSGADPKRDPRAAVARNLGAGTMVTGAYFLQSGQLRFEIEINGSTDDGRAGPTDQIVVPADSVEDGIDQVVQRTAIGVAAYLLPTWGELSPYASPPPSLSAGLDYLRSMQASSTGDWPESRRLAERALSRDSSWVSARLWLSVAHLNLGNLHEADSLVHDLEPGFDQMALLDRFYWIWVRSQLDGDREAAYRVARDLHERLPSNWFSGINRALEGLKVNRPGEAVEVLDDSRDDPSLMPEQTPPLHWRLLGSALHLLGQHQRELAEAKRSRLLYPDVGDLLQAEIRAQAALGNGTEVGKLVEEAFIKDARPLAALEAAAEELRVHGFDQAFDALRQHGLERLQPLLGGEEPGEANRPSLSLLGALYALEEWDRAREMAEALARQSPSNVYVLGYQGALAAREGDREAALHYSEQLAAPGPPYIRGLDTYRRARIASLLGNREEAVRLLRQAHEEGLSFGVHLHSDPDLLPLRGYPPFEEFMEPRG